MAQTIRAILLASAIAATFVGRLMSLHGARNPRKIRTSLAAQGSITGSEAITCNRRETMARSGLQAAVAGAVSAAYLSLSISSPGFAQGAPDLNTLTTQQAAADVCGGKLTSKALVKAALDRAKAKPELNAFITLDEADAMKAAAAFTSRRKNGPCKQLYCVSVVITDNTDKSTKPPSHVPALPT